MKSNYLAMLPAFWLLAAADASAETLYVDVNSTTPTPPYSSWATAATNIQEAVDVALAGDEIVVADGVYATGGRNRSRVTVTRPMSLRSVNGPQSTVIRGFGRCVTLPTGASLSGFTLTGGSTPTGLLFDGTGNPINPDFYSGGGVFCSSPTALVSNCVLVGNSAEFAGGGAFGGTLVNCTLTNNSAGWGGGAAGTFRCKLMNCTLTGNRARDSGGGAYGSGGRCVLIQCTLTNNSAGVDGSAARNCTLTGCLLIGNSSSFARSAARDCTLHNCVLTRNANEGARYCLLNNCTLTRNPVGAYGGTLRNCIIYDNGRNYDGNSSLSFCCTPDTPENGIGNIRNLSASINAGNNAYVTTDTDFAGRPRIIDGTVDIGAYEFQGPFNDWLQQHGLAADGTADSVDSDNDGYSNWREWIAGTVPTDALSALRLLAPAGSATGVAVTWQSVSNRLYTLQRSLDVGARPAFVTIATDIPGQPGTTTYMDVQANGPGPYFYRVEVQPDSRPFAYKTVNGAITITRFTGPAGAVTIPGTIKGLPVTGVANFAFYLQSGLTSVELPEGVTNIGIGAFFNCYNLTNVTLPNSLTSLGEQAFQSCYNLTSVALPGGLTSIAKQTFAGAGLTSITIPNGVTNIGPGAFTGCRFTSLSLPNSVISLGNSAFANCTSLTTVTLPDSLTSIPDSAFYSCASLTNITIPDTVTQIGFQAFSRCTSLASVAIPDSVIALVDEAFSSCASLASVTFGNGVIYLGASAFSNCSMLANVTLGTNVTVIGHHAFYWCTNLVEVTMPDSVTVIGDWAYYYCTSLADVRMGNGVVVVGEYAFANCLSLTNATLGPSVATLGALAFNGAGLSGVTIPRSVTNIAASTFSGCGSLATITVEPLNSAYSSLDGVLFDQNGTTLLQFPGGRAGAYTIPDGVARLAEGSFSACYKLTSINVPNSVTTIGNSAFAVCGSLTNVVIGEGVATIGDWAFYYCDKLAGVYFRGNAPAVGGTHLFVMPFGTLTTIVYYRPGTAGWGPTFAGRPTAVWSTQ